MRHGGPVAGVPGVRVRRLPVRATRRVDGVDVVLPEVALAQAVLEVDRLTAVGLMDSARSRKILTEREFQRARALTRGRRGAGRVNRWWDQSDPGSQSPAETVARLRCTDAGYPPDVLQLVVRDAAGGFLARVDLAWRLPDGRWLLGEIDGVEWHSGRRDVLADLARQNRIVTDQTILRRWTGTQAQNGTVAHEVAAILSAPAGPPPPTRQPRSTSAERRELSRQTLVAVTNHYARRRMGAGGWMGGAVGACPGRFAVEDAVVVGSGPGGLAAAVTMARAGLRVTVLEAEDTVGGGARTLDLGLAPGIVHDLCSAVHPMAWASPFFRAFDLAAHGVELLTPEASYAQPLDGRPAAVAYRSLERTVDGLGADGGAWASLVGTAAARWEAVTAVAMGDRRSVPPGLGSPRAMVGAMRFGLGVLEQGTPAWGRRWRTPEAAALLTGVAAHSITRLPSLAGAGTALLLAALAHAGVEDGPRPEPAGTAASGFSSAPGTAAGTVRMARPRRDAATTATPSTATATQPLTGGWAIPRGGSQAITDALVRDLRAHGGEVVTGARVRSRADLPAARAYLFDTTPRTLLDVLGPALPAGIRRALAGFRHGNAAAKVDFVLNGPVPWADPGGVGAIGRAGTVHLGGTREQMALAESEVAAGRHAAQPVTLVSDPTVVDGSRVVGGLRPLWAYAHVPAGSDVDVTEAVTAQLERFAPGFRDVVVASCCVPAAEMARHNQNYVGGDISAGAVSMWQMIARPTPRANPYRAAGGVYLCSASTPPGPGVHGMSGFHAARRALREVFGVRVAAL